MIIMPDEEYILPHHDELCFGCNNSMLPPLVLWMLPRGHIYLHPDCAFTLGVHLVKDAGIIQHLSRELVFPGWPSRDEGERES
jgi:hypothetical protein